MGNYLENESSIGCLLEMSFRSYPLKSQTIGINLVAEGERGLATVGLGAIQIPGPGQTLL
jgi:hypothetical protein